MSQDYDPKVDRRNVLKTLGVSGTAALAGCSGGGSTEPPEENGNDNTGQGTPENGGPEQQNNGTTTSNGTREFTEDELRRKSEALDTLDGRMTEMVPHPDDLMTKENNQGVFGWLDDSSYDGVTPYNDGLKEEGNEYVNIYFKNLQDEFDRVRQHPELLEEMVEENEISREESIEEGEYFWRDEFPELGPWTVNNEVVFTGKSSPHSPPAIITAHDTIRKKDGSYSLFEGLETPERDDSANQLVHTQLSELLDSSDVFSRTGNEDGYTVHEGEGRYEGVEVLLPVGTPFSVTLNPADVRVYPELKVNKDFARDHFLKLLNGKVNSMAEIGKTPTNEEGIKTPDTVRLNAVENMLNGVAEAPKWDGGSNWPETYEREYGESRGDYNGEIPPEMTETPNNIVIWNGYSTTQSSINNIDLVDRELQTWQIWYDYGEKWSLDLNSYGDINMTTRRRSLRQL